MDNKKLIKTWEMLKYFTENKDKSKIIKAYVANEEIRNDELYSYDFIDLIDGVFYWNYDLEKPFRLNDFYNVLDIDWCIDIAQIE